MELRHGNVRLATGPRLHFVEQGAAAVRDLPEPIPVEFAREFQASTAYLPLPPEFFDRLVAETLKVPARPWGPMTSRLLDYDDNDELGGIRASTLLIWDDKDALFARDDQDLFIAAQPSARLEVYGETGHCLNWERPERVAADLATFLCAP